MNHNKIAVISDIHGNSYALDAVLKDIKKSGIETIINLGDSLDGPLDPVGTYKLLKEYNVKSILGNGGRLIIENLDRDTGSPSFEYTKKQIDQEIIDWYKSLAFDINFEEQKLYDLMIQDTLWNCNNNFIEPGEYYPYVLASEAAPFDIVINEVMFDPEPPVGLPAFEYIEIFNTTDRYVSIKDWTLEVGTVTKEITAKLLNTLKKAGMFSLN